MTSPNTSLVVDSGSDPKMGLENLPQELKDQIYHYVLGECYCVHHCPPYYDGKYPAARELSRNPLFQTSKRVRIDAMEVCFSKVEFCWLLRIEDWAKSSWNLGFSGKTTLVTLWNQLSTDRLMNILLVWNITEYYGWHPNESNVRCDLLKSFGVAEILRKKIRIKFTTCSIFMPPIISTTYFQELTCLTGSQTLLAEMSISQRPWLNDNGTGKLFHGECLRKAMSDVLEPALGPAEIDSVESCPLVDHSTTKNKEISCFLAFHPRRYLTKLRGTEMTGRAKQAHQDLGPDGFQSDAEFLQQTQNEAARARSGSWAAIIPPSEEEAGALSATLNKDSGNLPER